MSAKPGLTAILNPQSGKGASLQVWNQIAASASSTFETTLAQTERPRHATQLAIDAISNGSTLILVVGGDGTLSEVVNGYIAANGKDKGVTLAIIHTGTGGDFAKSAGIPRNPLDAWNLVLKGNTLDVDAGKIACTPAGSKDYKSNERYFINIASFGISALLCKKLSESPKLLTKALGPLKYKAFILYCHLITKRPDISITTTTSTTSTTILHKKLYLAAIGNGKFFGNGLKVLRDSVISDGLFNTMTLRDPSTSEFVMYADSGLKHGDFHEKCPEKSEVGMAVNVVAEPVEVGGDGIGEEVWVEADGEVVGVLPAEFTVLPGAVRLIVP